jgi:hypothetical protein
MSSLLIHFNQSVYMLIMFFKWICFQNQNLHINIWNELCIGVRKKSIKLRKLKKII